LARDLAARSDVIVVLGLVSVIAAGEAVRTVPIVTLGVDPTTVGLAQSLSRPGGNVTGIAQFFDEMPRKRLELLHDALPTARRIAHLNRRVSVTSNGEDLIADLANAGFDVRLFWADGQEEYPTAFAAMREAGV
jgi:putative ABC transport system substrate-binding protein